MPKTSKSTIYAITYLIKQGKDTDYISTELGLSNKEIASIIAKNNIQPDEPAPIFVPTVRNTMINQTAGKREKGVSIMTKEASEMADEIIKKNHNQQLKDIKKGIFRPNSNE